MRGCPFHSAEESEASARTERTLDGDDLDRRDFVKSALLIGGTAAVGSLGSLAGISPTVRAAEHDPISAEARRNRQHAWDAFEPTVASGNSLHPAKSLILLLEYAHEGEPTPAHRREVADALRAIEEHFAWRPEGVLFTVAYSASYFDRFEEDPPAGAAPDPQAKVVETIESLTNDILPAVNGGVSSVGVAAGLRLAGGNIPV